MTVSPWIDEELSILGDHISRFAQKELLPKVDQWECDRRVDRESWKKAAAAGLLCASIPTEYGGSGGTRAHEAVIIQELAKLGLDSNIGAANSVSSGIVAHYILAYGTEQQRKRWLPGMSSGDIVGAIAMTEPGAGSDLQGIRTSAKKVKGGYLVNGQKTFISNGQTADLVLTVVTMDARLKGKGLSLLAIEPANTKGFRRGRNLEKIGRHGQDTSELFFDDVFVPEENLLGETEGRGFFQLVQQLPWERLSLALGAVSIIERAVDLTIAYAKERHAFGQPLIGFQNTQFKLAECKTNAVVARSFVDSLMVQLMAGQLSAETAAMAKWWTTDLLGKVADECLQLFGGYGYMIEYPIARIWANARVTRIFGGSTEIMKLLIARSL